MPTLIESVEWPLFDDYAAAELIALQAGNLPHRCAVETVNASDVWAVVATDLPCRLSPITEKSDTGGATVQHASATLLLALEAGSPHAGPRRRFTVTGYRPGGDPFTKVCYSLGARVPRVDETVAHVECREDPV